MLIREREGWSEGGIRLVPVVNFWASCLQFPRSQKRSLTKRREEGSSLLLSYGEWSSLLVDTRTLKEDTSERKHLKWEPSTDQTGCLNVLTLCTYISVTVCHIWSLDICIYLVMDSVGS